MFQRRGHTALTLFATAALVFSSACSGDDDSGDDTGGPDAGTRDSGPPRDAGPRRDAGPERDAGPPRDAGHYCAPSDSVQVDGVGVDVDPAPAPPMNEFGNGTLTCIDDPIETQPQPFEYCLFDCVNFLGPTPPAADVESLEVAIFRALDDNQDPVDPSYDRMTGVDRQASERLAVGYNFRPIDAKFCDSGWALEIGFTDLGPNPLFGEVEYQLRVSSSTSTAFIDTYYPNFIRRNASTPVAGSSCRASAVERTDPDVTYDFVVASRTLVDSAVTAAGVQIPGSDDYDDGMGNGYAMVEVRDCSNADGRPINNATAGFSPPPLADYFPDIDNGLARADRFTSLSGRYFGIGFAGTTATSSLARSVRFGVGVTRDGTCTEEYGGGQVAIQPDSLNVIHANNETILHSDE